LPKSDPIQYRLNHSPAESNPYSEGLGPGAAARITNRLPKGLSATLFGFDIFRLVSLIKPEKAEN
jgi:hypothetical protein